MAIGLRYSSHKIKFQIIRLTIFLLVIIELMLALYYSYLMFRLMFMIVSQSISSRFASLPTSILTRHCARQHDIGLSLDYTSVPPQDHLKSSPWTNRSKQSASHSDLLKNAATYGISTSIAVEDLVDEEPAAHETPIAATPLMEPASCDARIMSHGSDIPNSLNIERPTEPSLRVTLPPRLFAHHPMPITLNPPPFPSPAESHQQFHHHYPTADD